MGFDGLALVVLKQIRERALKRSRRSTRESRCMATGFDAVACRFEADQPGIRIVDERVKDTDRIRTTTDARCDGIRQPARLRLDLRTRLEPDHPLEIAHHRRKRMGPSRGAEAVVRVVGVGDPVPEGLVDRVLQRLGAGLDRHHLRAKQPHPRDVEGLTCGVDRTHVDDALQTQQCTGRRSGHPVLARTRLRDHPRLAHLLRQQRLTEHIVDLVRSGVVEVFSLQEEPRSSRMIRKAWLPRTAATAGRCSGVATDPIHRGTSDHHEPSRTRQ